METICIAPALIIKKKEIDRIIETLDAAIPVMEKKLLP
jgi:adenosylmethionine-8-amino-7-oxononanoate aminotransferase